jgi:hypothetical protein
MPSIDVGLMPRKPFSAKPEPQPIRSRGSDFSGTMKGKENLRLIIRLPIPSLAFLPEYHSLQLFLVRGKRRVSDQLVER